MGNERFTVHVGDNLPILKTLPDNLVDAIVTDPPAGIGFMQRDWDSDKGGRDKWIDWMAEVAAECLRVIKPGGHALVWALPRTSHWTATAWENAGWEPRDRICHVFSTGFPKSANISKMIDKAAGAEQECTRPGVIKRDGYGGNWDTGSSQHRPRFDIPATDAAKQWDGWGTALKPAVEDYWLFRKPLAKRTVAANVLEWGTGGVNVDGCRVGAEKGRPLVVSDRRDGNRVYRDGLQGSRSVPGGTDAGRFPANLIHDGSDEVVELFPQSTSGANPTRRGGMGYHGAEGQESCDAPRGAESGSAARFFYCAKASRSEREAGLEGDKCTHPTVKPIALMRYLCRLITPPGGVVLDPFTGSGTTGCAAMLEGFRFIGLEREEQYVEIALKRIEYWRQVAEHTPPSAEQAQMTLLDIQDE